MMKAALLSLATATLACSLGCQATIGGTGGGDSTDPPGGGGPGVVDPGNPGNTTTGGMTTTGGKVPGAMANPDAAGPMPLTRLTRREYNNTIRDLLGDTSKPGDTLPEDVDGDFLFRRAGSVSTLDASTLRDAAEAVATTAEKSIAKLVTCDYAGTAEAACAKTFVQTFGAKAFRRPLTDAEVTDLTTLFQAGRTTMMLPFAGAIHLVIEALLQSPAFLYHWEQGTAAPVYEGKVIRLGPYEMAARLSYFLWGSIPDQALTDAAATGHLATEADLEAQAQRMLADPKAHETVMEFVNEWLNLDQIPERPKDPTLYPEFKDDLKAAMVAESQAFIENVVFEGDGLFSTLLTANFSFVNQSMAPVYGLGNMAGTTLARTSLNPAQRSGLLTQLGFLTVTGATDGSDPPKRGRKVFERLLCGTLPPPPPNVPPAKPASAGGTTRQRFTEHDTNACATACHSIMDPVGFGFEHYDGIGRYRDTDNGQPVDSTGSIVLDGAKKPFADAREMMQLLSVSQDAHTCFATQWTRFAYRRNETDADQASINAVVASFTKSNTVHDLLVGVTGSRSFRYRNPAVGEAQ